MDSQSSTRSNSIDRLHMKIDRAIRDVSGSGRPRRVFIENVWPKLKADYEMMVEELIKFCKRQLDEKAIPAMVDGRVKSSDSIEKSLERREEHRIEHQKNSYESLEEIFCDIHDLAGIRIVVDYQSDIDSANRFINLTFQATKEPNVFSSDRQVGSSWKPWFGAFKSRNHHVTLKPETEGVLQSYCKVTFEIQLTDLSESLYNRLAHPLLYKKSSGNLSRKEEMVIDMAHALALCYSICLLYMQDKLEGPSRPSGQQIALRDAMRKAVPPPGVHGSDSDMHPLLEMAPTLDIASSSEHEAVARIDASFGLKRRASFDKTVPVETLVAALQTPPDECNSTDDVEAWVFKKLKNAIEDATQPPVQLPKVEDARYESSDVQRSPKCHEGTRANVRPRVHSFLNDAEKMLLLHTKATLAPRQARVLPPSQSAQATESNLFDPKHARHSVLANSPHQPLLNPGFIRMLALSPDQKTLATSSDDHPLLLWDVERGTLLHDFAKAGPSTEKMATEKMAFSPPDGKMLAVASFHEVELWEVATRRLQWHYKDPDAWILKIAFSLDGNTLAAGRTGLSLVQLWDVATGSPQWDRTDLDGSWALHAVAFSPHGTTLAVGYDKTVELWEVARGTLRAKFDCAPFLKNIPWFISRISFSSDGNILELASPPGGPVLLWDVVTLDVRAFDPDAERHPKTKSLDARTSVQFPWVTHGFNKILRIPPTYRDYKKACAGSRLVMAHKDGEFIVLGFDLAGLNDI